MILGLGLDLADAKRIERAVAREGESFLEEFLLPDEIKTCRDRRDPYPCYAARFAAKEALVKALGTGGVSWREIEVVSEPSGKPRLEARGGVAEEMKAQGVTSVHLSLTHEGKLAAAVVALEGNPLRLERPGGGEGGASKEE